MGCSTVANGGKEQLQYSKAKSQDGARANNWTYEMDREESANILKGEILERLGSHDRLIPWKDLMKKKIIRRIVRWGPEVGGVEKSDLDQVGWALPISLLYGTMFLVALLYFSISGTNQSLNAKYLSMSGTTSNQICDVVPQTLTANFEGDFHGYWATDQMNFNTNSSIFALQFTGSHIGDGLYSDTMVKFSSKLRVLGEKAKSRTVAWASFMWSTFNFKDEEAHLQFYSSVDAGIMVSQQQLSNAAWSSRYGVCNDSAVTSAGSFIHGSYDDSTKSLTLHMPLDAIAIAENLAFREDVNYDLTFPSVAEPCPYQGVSSHFNSFQYFFYQKEFSLSFDVRTIATIFALNMGVIVTSDLVEVVPAFDRVSLLSGVPGSFWIDPFYSPMTPIFCIDKNSSVYNLTQKQINGPEVCFLAMSGNSAAYAPLYYPVIDQFHNTNTETSFGTVQPCRCPDDSTNRQCNQMDFFYTLITNSLNTNNDASEMVLFGLQLQQMLVDDPNSGDIAILNYTAPITIVTVAASPSSGFPLDSPISEFYSCDWDENPFLSGIPSSLTVNEAMTMVYDTVFPSGTFSAVVFETFYSSKSAIFEPVNQYYVQLGTLSNETYLDTYWNVTVPKQMCTDTLSQVAAMASLSTKPPVPLVQDYFVCRPTVAAAASAAIGSAAGSASLYSTIAITLLGFFIVKYVNLASGTGSSKEEQQTDGNGRGEGVVSNPVRKQLLPATLKSDAKDLKDRLEKDALLALLEGLVSSSCENGQKESCNDNNHERSAMKLSGLLKQLKKYSVDLDE